MPTATTTMPIVMIMFQGKLNASAVEVLASTVEAMSAEEVSDLLTGDVVAQTLPAMRKNFKRMGNAARRALIHRV
jgi:hypothetical protein